MLQEILNSYSLYVETLDKNIWSGFIDGYYRMPLAKCIKGYPRTRFIQLLMAVNRRLKLFPLLIYLMCSYRKRSSFYNFSVLK